MQEWGTDHFLDLLPILNFLHLIEWGRVRHLLNLSEQEKQQQRGNQEYRGQNLSVCCHQSGKEVALKGFSWTKKHLLRWFVSIPMNLRESVGFCDVGVAGWLWSCLVIIYLRCENLLSNFFFAKVGLFATCKTLSNIALCLVWSHLPAAVLHLVRHPSCSPLVQDEAERPLWFRPYPSLWSAKGALNGQWWDSVTKWPRSNWWAGGWRKWLCVTQVTENSCGVLASI